MESTSLPVHREIKHNDKLYHYERTLDEAGTMIVAVYLDSSANHRMIVKFEKSDKSRATFNEEVIMQGLHRK